MTWNKSFIPLKLLKFSFRTKFVNFPACYLFIWFIFAVGIQTGIFCTILTVILRLTTGGRMHYTKTGTLELQGFNMLVFVLHCDRNHPLRSAGRLWPIQLAGKLLHRLPVQHDVCWSHLGLAHQDGHLGRSEGAHPCLRSVSCDFTLIKHCELK